METLIFLHGFTETTSMWGFIKEMSLDEVECIYEDVNSYFEKPTSLKTVAQEILKKYEDLKSISVIGHSMGGYIALQMLSEKGTNVQAITLMNSTTTADDTAKKASRDKGIDFIHKHGLDKYLTSLIPQLYIPDTEPSTIEKHIMAAQKIKTQTLQNQLAAMRDREDSTEVFIQSPILKQWIIGVQDPLIDCEKILARVPEFAEIILNLDINSGHMSYVENKPFAQDAVQELIDYTN